MIWRCSKKMTDIRDLTEDEAYWLRKGACPCCLSRSHWRGGPTGGSSQNVYCDNCGAGFNVMPHPFISEMIQQPTKQYKKGKEVVVFMGGIGRFAGGPKRWVPVVVVWVFFIAILVVMVA